MSRISRSFPVPLVVAVLSAALAACGGNQKAEAPPSGETFGAGDRYSRTYLVPPATACEATRRALLGQGYVIGPASAEALEATKNFQPESDTHTQIKVRATCLAQMGGGSIVFVNAVQDTYELNTTVKSANVGVSMIGSLSVPIGTSGGDLVRVATTTIQNEDFYRRFFERVAFYMPATQSLGPEAAPAAFETLPEPPPVEPAATDTDASEPDTPEIP